ncbi:YaaR family protein [Garciella nitratireducens]|uniref:YaaR family protein n=1 Tax=Garciella nitratireducens TaxID=218205 RepID=UPI000DE8A133|nr:YaaR family protein [Garciella nitratireducens]RBP40621.1 uncharacterized protein YaaR (DUF327 family) [Garciella nitratireducens]
MKISRNDPIKKRSFSPTKRKSPDKNFSSQFQFANNQQRKEHLKKLLSKIEKKGKQIIQSNSIKAVEEYKSLIHEYLSFFLYSGYKIQKIENSWKGMNPMTIVKVLDKELEQLSQFILKEQQDTLAIINKIDTISGILLDTYQ